jgi:hypothetical protein
MLRRVALVRTDVSGERTASIIMVTRIDEVGTTLAVTSNYLQLLVTAKFVPSSSILVTMMMEALCSLEKSFLTRTTRRNIPDDGILHSLRRENLKSYMDFISQETAFFSYISSLQYGRLYPARMQNLMKVK